MFHISSITLGPNNYEFFAGNIIFGWQASWSKQLSFKNSSCPTKITKSQEFCYFLVKFAWSFVSCISRWVLASIATGVHESRKKELILVIKLTTHVNLNCNVWRFLIQNQSHIASLIIKLFRWIWKLFNNVIEKLLLMLWFHHTFKRQFRKLLKH